MRFDVTADGEWALAREGRHWRGGWRMPRTPRGARSSGPAGRSAGASADHGARGLDGRRSATLAKYGGPDVCFGAYVPNGDTGQVHTILARATILATGGAGKVYLYTSNPDVATGDGVAMAYRAGAQVGNMVLSVPSHLPVSPRGQVVPDLQALRGEGGVLKLRSGETFMERYHPMKSLAPRCRGPRHRLRAQAHRR